MFSSSMNSFGFRIEENLQTVKDGVKLYKWVSLENVPFVPNT